MLMRGDSEGMARVGFCESAVQDAGVHAIYSRVKAVSIGSR